jgi:hypothetical protein
MLIFIRCKCVLIYIVEASFGSNRSSTILEQVTHKEENSFSFLSLSLFMSEHVRACQSMSKHVLACQSMSPFEEKRLISGSEERERDEEREREMKRER